MKPLIRKSWYTLSEAADYLTQITEGQSRITVSDVLQLAVEGELSLSIYLFSGALAQTGHIKWLMNYSDEVTIEEEEELAEYPTAFTTSDEVDLSFANGINSSVGGPLRFIPDQYGEMAVMTGHYWQLTAHGWGGELERKLWRLSFENSPEKMNRPPLLLPPEEEKIPGSITIFGKEYTLKGPAKELYFLPHPEEEGEPWVMKMLWTNLPDDTLFGVTREDLDNLLTDSEPGSTSKADETDTERKRAQRTLAALATGLASKYPTYKNGSKPNATQLARLATDHLRDASSDRTPHGFGETTARLTIAEALKACPDLTET